MVRLEQDCLFRWAILIIVRPKRSSEIRRETSEKVPWPKLGE
jgi:hypothetical protein